MAVAGRHGGLGQETGHSERFDRPQRAIRPATASDSTGHSERFPEKLRRYIQSHEAPCHLVYLSPCLLVYLSTCLPVYLSTCLLVYLSTCLLVTLSRSPAGAAGQSRIAVRWPPSPRSATR
ncbi:MAG: hypothetical protein CVU38_08990 [Chloroflexi bacterium HGW-Chloroflexi-1]|nr:MAG: hypothetical protein CVU38_08990 [Chloroflexi bacterium HGW-Chloroflexi-1]